MSSDVAMGEGGQRKWERKSVDKSLPVGEILDCFGIMTNFRLEGKPESGVEVFDK